MPRRPMKHRKRLSFRPLTCSPFARSFARVASGYRVKRQIDASKYRRKSLPSFEGSRFSDGTLKEEIEQSESSDEEFDGVVQVDFAGFDIKESDFHGVKTLLQTYLDDKQWDLSGFADLIVGQTSVGTVLKVEDDEDEGIFSVVTALNLGRYKDHKCIVELKDFLLKGCQDQGVVDNLRSLLGEQAPNVGLLVSQRVTNLPPQILPNLYDALFDEVSRATKNEPTEDLWNYFRFKHYLIVSKIYKHKNIDRKKNTGVASDEDIIYIKPEDEIFHKLSMWSFCFPLHDQQLAAHELRNYKLMGLVMAVETDKTSAFRQELISLISDS